MQQVPATGLKMPPAITNVAVSRRSSLVVVILSAPSVVDAGMVWPFISGDALRIRSMIEIIEDAFGSR